MKQNKYNRQQMLRMVNHDRGIREAYMSLVDDLGIDDALQEVYNERIHETTIEHYQKLWDSLAVNDELPVPESEVTQSIRRIINTNGWRGLAKGLIEYLENQRRTMKGLGLQDSAETYSKLRDHIQKVSRKRMVE